MNEKGLENQHTIYEANEKRRRRCCCCCRTRRSKQICCLIVLLVLIGLAIALYFCIPRGNPEIQFKGVETVGNLDFTSLALNAGTGMNIPLVLKLSVQNPNLISIKMNNITATGFYQIPDGTSVQVGKGALNHTITFPAKGGLDFALPFTLTYNPKTDKSSAAALSGLLAHCGITASTKTQIPLTYKAVLDIALISWLGIKPEIQNNVKFDCPVDVPAGVGEALGPLLGPLIGNGA
ncbi:hypothetical protein K493DRAFT_340698 [Basidiobolus meristosporus CBS 931.73]|uniref:Late embryogenesis abundant protein LEA-2 subgroup domain-containing protein n=1 Tax=Basidiobolus meristosporus CBS 931.73 TaxID=1314790 RepID=A0A1Y1XUD2_9FUNG|nr:hypothetical protein K493DRAFT_340698 [Basidiobolus meristosporus CBS 931.73]|eukprot:ORX89358.1 hypothetical protein K493DRAFT_340698 [Basidiobolus meristosporus CBS 931.73]